MTRLTLITAFLLTACSTVQQTGTPGQKAYSYRADMQMTIGGASFDGVGSWKLTGPVAITIKSPVALDRLQITSCARSDVFQAQPNPFTYQYTPSPTELSGACPLYIQAFSKAALISWGLLGFRSDETLKSHAYLNGQGITFAGFITGQSQAGLEQSLDFDDAVKFSADKECNLTTTNSKNFIFKPEAGICHATFGIKKDSVTQWARLLFVAYSGVLLR